MDLWISCNFPVRARQEALECNGCHRWQLEHAKLAFRGKFTVPLFVGVCDPCNRHEEEIYSTNYEAPMVSLHALLFFLVLMVLPFLPHLACSRRLDCGEQRKAARGARVVEREDWERGEETPVKLILKSSCRPLLTADSACGFQLSIKIVVDFPGNMVPLRVSFNFASLSMSVNTASLLSNYLQVHPSSFCRFCQ